MFSQRQLGGWIRKFGIHFSVTLIAVLSLINCTSHPLMMPEPLAPGESFHGFLFSSENGLPEYVYRRNILTNADLGLRVGLLPTQGDGLDIQYRLIQVDNHIHSLDLSAGYGVDQNNNFSLTYLNSKKKPRKKKIRQGRKVFYKVSRTNFNYSYFGIRYMLIPHGLGGDTVHRLGALWGLNYNRRWGIELGYFHDFGGGLKTTDLGQPSEHAPITGLSARFWVGGIRLNQ